MRAELGVEFQPDVAGLVGVKAFFFVVSIMVSFSRNTPGPNVRARKARTLFGTTCKVLLNVGQLTGIAIRISIADNHPVGPGGFGTNAAVITRIAFQLNILIEPCAKDSCFFSIAG
jgi:hypothetical protein